MSQREINKKIQWTASVLGVLLASSGVINHGIFEILQGNTATGGLFIEAIGIHHRFWVHGTEGAFTLIPNFLLTGVATVFIGLFAMIWSAKFLDTKHGVKIFFLSFVLWLYLGEG